MRQRAKGQRISAKQGSGKYAAGLHQPWKMVGPPPKQGPLKSDMSFVNSLLNYISEEPKTRLGVKSSLTARSPLVLSLAKYSANLAADEHPPSEDKWRRLDKLQRLLRQRKGKEKEQSAK